MADLDPRVTTFRRLHESGCFVIPNPWDVGSARLLERLGFPALATTSSGFVADASSFRYACGPVPTTGDVGAPKNIGENR